MGEAMSFNIAEAGEPAEAAKKLRNPDVWYRQNNRAGALTADYLAAVADIMTAATGKTVTFESSGHVDPTGGSVTLTIKTYS